MAKIISYYSKRTGLFFRTQKEFKFHLSALLNKYLNSEVPVNVQDRLLLIDYLEDFHSSKEWFSDNFNLEIAEFFVAKPEGYPKKKCFHIKSQKEGQKDTDFGISKFIPTTGKQNLSNCLRYAIKDIKIEIRKFLEPDDWDKYDLVHKTPKFKDTIQKFIEQESLQNKLEEVVSSNYGDENVPELMPNYLYLKDKFIQFYQKEYSDYKNQYVLKQIV